MALATGFSQHKAAVRPLLVHDELPHARGHLKSHAGSGHAASAMLTRVLVLQAYGVWWFPPMVLNCAAFLLSLAWGLLIFTLSWLRWQSGTNGTQVRFPYSILALLCRDQRPHGVLAHC